MAYSADVVANAFLKLAKEEQKGLTNMQLQKLVYIAHGFCLAMLSRPLFFNNVHAFEWGPVIPKLYKQLRKYGSGIITEEISTIDEPILSAAPEMAVIRGVWGSYGNFTGAKLSSITHQEGTPWSLTWKSIQFGVIENDLIASHYQQMLNEQTIG
jgi:uncharacterized phage-associated protein